MILKSYIIEKSVESLVNYNSVLLYGENDGIKDDIKKQLKLIRKDTEIINLFQEEIIKNKDCLFERVNNTSLFSEKKTIFIQEASDKILNEINEVLGKENNSIKIYIFSAVLDKKSKLRNLYEKQTGLAILPCYKDTDRTLITYVTNELKELNGVTQEIINLIISNSNGERKLIKNEINKIKSCFSNKKIKKEELEELLNIRINTNFDELRDSALLGAKDKFNKHIGQTEFLPEENYFYINNLNLRVAKLIEIQKLNKSFRNIASSLEATKPKIFWKDKPIFIQQLQKWNINKLQKILKKIYETEILMKQNTQIRNDLLIKKLLMSIYSIASSSS